MDVVRVRLKVVPANSAAHTDVGRYGDATVADVHSQVITAAWLCPMDRPPVRNGGVEIQHDKITRCGELSELIGSKNFEQRLHLEHGVILPGLINPHTHLELSCYRDQIPAQPLWTWFRELIRLRREPGAQQREQDGIRAAVTECLGAGVTCVGDISRTGASAAILKDLPIRKVCFAELLSIATEPPRMISELSERLDRASTDELLTMGVSAHAPYTVHPQDVRAAVELARQRGLPWCMHWLETLEERLWLSAQADALPAFFSKLHREHRLSIGTSSPREYMERALSNAPPGLLAHGNYIAREEIDFLAQHGHTIAYCPRTHRYFGHAPHPLRQLRDAGVPVTLATDSLASNPTLSVLEEARFLFREHPGLASPVELFRMITVDAAAALGLENEIGSITAGKRADLVAFAMNAVESDPLQALLAGDLAPLQTYVAGRRVFGKEMR